MTEIGRAASVGPSRDGNEQLQQNAKSRMFVLGSCILAHFFPLSLQKAFPFFFPSVVYSPLCSLKQGRIFYVLLFEAYLFAVTKSAVCFLYAYAHA